MRDMKTTAILLLAFSLALPAAASSADEPSRDIVQTAVDAGSFKTLAAALGQAGLVDALKGPGPFTVFAPTDAAFAALPEGTVASLLEPANRERLKAILTYHVVSGRILSSDLLATTAARTLQGSSVAIGLRVGDANVVKADILCSNGVIHVIDRVLVPDQTTAPHSPSDVIGEALRRGVPLYNAGDAEACASVYAAAARLLLKGEALADLHRASLAAVLDTTHASASDQAWALRHVFDQILADERFEPRMEAPMPKGFPAPGPVGRVVTKEYPRYRAARADGGNSFWTLFNHIKKNDVQMTTPVEMTMNEESMRPVDMAFLYEAADQGSAGQQGSVAVLDLEPTVVLSIGMRGERTTEDIARAKAAIEAHAAAQAYTRAGSWRLMGYNSPMVPAESRFWELQLPVTRGSGTR